MESENARKLREAREALGAFPVPPNLRDKLEGLADVIEDQQRRLAELEEEG